MKRRLRQGAKLIVADPRRIDLVRTPHIEAAHHLALRPGTNVALINSLAHVVVTEGLVKEDFVRARCEVESFEKWRHFVAEPRNSPEAMESVTGVPAAEVRRAARLFATAGNGAIYYGLGVTEHSQGSTMVMGIANLAMATGNVGRVGVGVNPLRGQNNVQGSCDMGSFPHEFPGYRHVSDDATRQQFERKWNVKLLAEPGLRIPDMFEAALDGEVRSQYPARDRRAERDGMHHRPGPVPQRERQVRARVPARLLVPGKGRHLHQRRAAHLAGAQGHAFQVRVRRLGDHAIAFQRARIPDELPPSERDHG
jgi:formate dehydrogenase major subunit